MVNNLQERLNKGLVQICDVVNKLKEKADTNFTDVAKLFGMNAAVLHDEWKYARRAPEDVELTIMASCPRLRATFPALSQLAVRLLLLPIGTATCERTFSAMNRLLCSKRAMHCQPSIWNSWCSFHKKHQGSLIPGTLEQLQCRQATPMTVLSAKFTSNLCSILTISDTNAESLTCSFAFFDVFFVTGLPCCMMMMTLPSKGFQCIGWLTCRTSCLYGFVGSGMTWTPLGSPVGSRSYHFQECKQEGQHPLTEQRAANFRLLANQWAERRLVTQWRHGCRAIIIFLSDHDFPLTGSNFGNLTAFRAIFSHIFSAHAQERPFMNFRLKFWHHHYSIPWSRFPYRERYFGDTRTFSVDFCIG